MAQGDEPNAKDDTRFYSTTSAGLEVDLSHQADDILVGTNSYYESGAQARWDVYPCTIELDLTFNDTDTGYLYTYEVGGQGVRIVLAANGVIDAYVDGSSVAQVTVPDIDAGGDNVIVSWSMEANPRTTGASDALRSELRVFNIDDSSYTQDVATHAQPTSVSSTVVWLARTSGGSAAFTGTANSLRFSFGRFHPAAEAREDLVGLTTAPSLDLETRLEVPVPTRASGIGAHDYFAGPVYKFVSAGLGQSDLRQAGYIWAEHFTDDPDQDESFPTNRDLAVPDAAGFTLLGQYMVARPVPKTCNRLKIRVQVQAWRTDANPADDIVIRAYVMNRPPIPAANLPAPHPAWDRRFASVTVNANDGSGTTGGDWYEFDLLEVVRTPGGGGTIVGLAFDVQDAGGAGPTSAQRWKVRAWTGEPGLEEVDGGLPLT